MQRSSLLLAGSLIANVALAALLLSGRAASNPDGSAPTATAASSATPRRMDQASSSTAAATHAGRLSWSLLHPADDLSALVARLRDAGFPPSVVRGIIRSLVAARFDAQRYEIDHTALETPYWKHWSNSYGDPKIGPQLRRLDLEQEKLVRELLGERVAEAATETEEGRANLDRQYGSLPREKLDRLTAYLAGYYENQNQVYSAARRGGGMLGADWEKLIANEQEMRRGIAELLTPAEAQEFLLRNGLAAQRLQTLLGPARVTEQEYRAILPLYQSLADTVPLPFSPVPAQGSSNAGRSSAEEAMLAQLVSAVGVDRAAELKIALDPRYGQLNRLVSRLELPLTVAPQIVEVQQDIQHRAAEIRSNAALSASSRSDQLAALAQEASTRLADALGGSRGLNVYRENGGQWLDSLVPPKG